MEELISSFEKENGIECEMILGSSGKLTAQIKEHAPFDIFVSADLKYPEELYRSGFSESEVIIYAYGKLILISVKKNIIPDLNDLNRKEIRHIALGNPKTAPYGTAAMEVLKKKSSFQI
jgi:molybdate transport system substrate-binding protein